MKIDEILKMLELPEEEQMNWLSRNTEISFKSHLTGEESLADLAFRLRDEAWCGCSEGVWAAAITKVARQAFGDWIESVEQVQSSWICLTQPIHWIAAALIAQELKGQKE
jgi:hypothetical protein